MTIRLTSQYLPLLLLSEFLPCRRYGKTFSFGRMINFSIDLADYRAQLEKEVEVVSQHRGPLIISGDFNNWNTARMKILADITQELGAQELVFDTDHRSTFMGQHFDHIFYRKLVPLEALTEKVTTSDHNPMLVTFRVADEA